MIVPNYTFTVLLWHYQCELNFKSLQPYWIGIGLHNLRLMRPVIILFIVYKDHVMLCSHEWCKRLAFLLYIFSSRKLFHGPLFNPENFDSSFSFILESWSFRFPIILRIPLVKCWTTAGGSNGDPVQCPMLLVLVIIILPTTFSSSYCSLYWWWSISTFEVGTRQKSRRGAKNPRVTIHWIRRVLCQLFPFSSLLLLWRFTCQIIRNIFFSSLSSCLFHFLFIFFFFWFFQFWKILNALLIWRLAHSSALVYFVGGLKQGRNDHF